MMGMNFIFAVVAISAVVSAIVYGYRFAMKDALNMYPRSPKRTDDEDGAGRPPQK
jgi:hypothetical protein